MWQQQKSLLVGGAFLTGAVIVLSLQVRPYGLMFSILLAFWLYKTRCPNFKLITSPTITNCGEHLYQDYLQFRQKQPRLCWIYTSCVLVALAVLGHIVSGKIIIVFGLLLATLILSKHKVTIVDVQQEDEKNWSSQNADLDEFLPDVNESNLSLLQHAGEEAVILHSISPLNANDEDEKSDEIPSDLIISDSLPEIDEQTDSSDEECSISPAVTSLAQKLSLNQEIEFNSGYFKDTSSSDDDSISKGLTFNDYSIVDGAQRINETQNKFDESQRSRMLSIPSMVVDLMTNLTKGSRNLSEVIAVDKSKSLPKGPDKRHISESSDESEFEILSTDELNIN